VLQPKRRDDDPSCVPAFTNAKVDNLVQADTKSAGANYHITITAELICIIDPASDFRKIRSPKCLSPVEMRLIAEVCQ
jgi:hypothetical protein